MKINEFYVKDEILTQMKSAFDATDQFTHVQLSELYSDFESIKKIADDVTLTQQNDPLSFRRKEGVLTNEQSNAIITPELQKIITSITGKKLSKLQFYAYAHKDYSMLLDSDNTSDRIDIILDISDSWDESWGGTFIYADEEGEYIELPANPNSLTILKAKKDEKSFLKYINHYSEESMRKFLFCSFRS
jgi:hypothetical protein